MANEVAGELYYDLDGQLLEIKRQLRQKGGYPFDPMKLKGFLQKAIEGKFFLEMVVALSVIEEFDPAIFIGQGWEEKKDSDPRSRLVTEISLEKMIFETCLKEKESSISGEEKLRRIKKSGFIPYGAKQFFAIWQDWLKNGASSLLEQLYQTRGITYIDFFGAILRDPDGNRSVLYLYRSVSGKWDWCCSWLVRDWGAYSFSVGSASQ
jgi:hypothetical protein